jgi:two-component system phosphate regulon sensor histidine kinase PhoR
MFDDPKVVTECYNVITKETRRLSRLIEDILSISQMEVGSIQLVADDVDVRTLVSEAVRDVRGLADEKGIDLQMKLPAKLGTIQGDRDKLSVVLNNLLGNALKYTPTEGSVHLGCTMTDTHLTVTVKDTGLGIDPADHERIFEKFQRANDPEVQNEAGTGIGLTTAREIVRRHGGDIKVMSAKGEGSTFVVKIPLSTAHASAVPAAIAS